MATQRTDVPGIVFLEIDGLALPVLRDAMRDGNAPNMARWVAEDGYRLAEWETDLSSQTGACQAGILLGSNDDIPAFRWVEKESERIYACSVPRGLRRDRAPAGDRRRAARRDGGASRGNLLSGEADEVDPHRQPHRRANAAHNPGYRAFFANGFNVTRTLVLFIWEIVIELTGLDPRGAARRPPARAPRRDLSADARLRCA